MQYFQDGWKEKWRLFSLFSKILICPNTPCKSGNNCSIFSRHLHPCPPSHNFRPPAHQHRDHLQLHLGRFHPLKFWDQFKALYNKSSQDFVIYHICYFDLLIFDNFFWRSKNSAGCGRVISKNKRLTKHTNYNVQFFHLVTLFLECSQLNFSSPKNSLSEGRSN